MPAAFSAVLPLYSRRYMGFPPGRAHGQTTLQWPTPRLLDIEIESGARGGAVVNSGIIGRRGVCFGISASAPLIRTVPAAILLIVITHYVLHCMSPLLAQSGHQAAEFRCPLSGVADIDLTLCNVCF